VGDLNVGRWMVWWIEEVVHPKVVDGYQKETVVEEVSRGRRNS